MYLLYETLVVHTDHQAMYWLMTTEDPSDHLMQWRMSLA